MNSPLAGGFAKVPYLVRESQKTASAAIESWRWRIALLVGLILSWGLMVIASRFQELVCTYSWTMGSSQPFAAPSGSWVGAFVVQVCLSTLALSVGAKRALLSLISILVMVAYWLLMCMWLFSLLSDITGTIVSSGLHGN